MSDETSKGLLGKLIVLAVLALITGKVSFLFFDFELPQQAPPAAQRLATGTAAGADDPILTAKRQTHILHGDATGGGHLYGTGKACKSEFPQDWKPDKIISVVKGLAANDNALWRREDNGYHTAEQMAGGLRIRVVLSADKTQIITAYPVNVPRNPCPPRRPANDNFND